MHLLIKFEWNTCLCVFYETFSACTVFWQRVTVQCVLITDHVSTYTIYHYIDVNIGNQGLNIRIGYDSKTSAGNENPYSFTESAYKMGVLPGNTGTSRLHNHFTYYPSFKNSYFKASVHILEENRLGYTLYLDISAWSSMKLVQSASSIKLSRFSYI